MQKMMLFLGHPIYAVTVVLTALLAFAGLGALLLVVGSWLVAFQA